MHSPFQTSRGDRGGQGQGSLVRRDRSMRATSTD